MPSETTIIKRLATISELYSAGVNEIKASGESFKKFLDFIVPFSELSFDNQVIVYDQKPTATRLATYNAWHEVYGRGCGKGKGLLITSNTADRYVHVFDVTDTYKLKDHNLEQDIILEQDFLPVTDRDTADNMLSILDVSLDIMCNQAETAGFLNSNELTAESVAAWKQSDPTVKALALECVKYVVSKRCGVEYNNTENLIDSLNVVVDYDAEKFIAFGELVSDFTAKYFRIIQRVSNKLHKEEVLNNDNEFDVQERGRSISSDSRYGRHENSDREIWSVETQVSDDELQSDVDTNEDVRRGPQEIGGVQSESNGDGNTVDRTDGGEGEEFDAGQDDESDSLGRLYGEYPFESTGNGYSRDGERDAGFSLSDLTEEVDKQSSVIKSSEISFSSGQTSLFPAEDLIAEAEEIANKTAAVFDASPNPVVVDNPEDEVSAFETVVAAVGHGDTDSESVITDEDIDNVIINCVYNHLVKGTICSLIDQYDDMSQAERDKFLLSDIERLFAAHTLPVVNSCGRDIKVEFNDSEHIVNLTDTVSGDIVSVSRSVFCGTRLFDLYKDGLFLEPSLERDGVTAYLALNQPFKVYASGLNSFPENVRDNLGVILFERLLNPEQQKHFLSDYSDLVSLKDFENYRTEYIGVITNILDDLHNTGAAFDDTPSDDSSVHLKLAVGEDDDTVLYVYSSAGDLHANANFIAGSIIQSAVEGKITQDNVKQDTSIQKDDFATNSGIVSARWRETGEYDYEGHDKNAVSDEVLNEPFRVTVDYTLENLSAMSAYDLAKNIVNGYRDALFAQDFYKGTDRYITFDKLDPLFNTLLSGDLLGAEKTKEVISIVFDTLLNGKHKSIANAFFSHRAMLDIPFVKINFSAEYEELTSHYANYHVTDQNIEEYLVRKFTYSAEQEPERYENFYRTITDSEKSSKDKIAYLKGHYGQGSSSGLGLFHDGYYGGGEISSFKADGLEFTKESSDYTKADRRFLKWPAVLRAYQTYIMEGKMPEPAIVYERHDRWRASRGYGIVYEPETDIFTAHAEAIVNPVNTVGVMGKGLALAFKEKYPEMFEDYKTRCDNGTFDTGSICCFNNTNNEPNVICFPTKKDWRDKSELEYISSGLDALREHIKDHYIRSVAIPKLGCGLGGLDWNDVRSLMEEKLGDLDCRVIVLGEAPEQNKNLETEDTKTTEPVQEDLDFGDSDTEGIRRGSAIFDTADNEIRSADGAKAAEIDDTPYYDYEIPAGGFLRGGDKARFADNVQAIVTLKRIESDNRRATPEEQDILAKYVGWGGLADAFDPTKKTWNKEYNELRQILTTDEYKAARESTLTAYYTPDNVVRSIYQMIEDAGFSGGRVLDPSMGIGNFFGCMPEGLRNCCELYGIELDSITGRIAKQLYQSANIEINGFESTVNPDGVFDLVISNIPFGDFAVNDPEYNKHKFKVHDYFFAKAINKVRPGGIVAFITSTGTLDKNNSKLREYIAKRADLLGAVRLPYTTFEKEAGTEVTSDIIFLRRKARSVEFNETNMPAWVTLDSVPITVHDGDKVFTKAHLINSYFVTNPENILGTLETGVVRMLGRTDLLACVPHNDRTLDYYLENTVKRFKQNGEISYIEADEAQKKAIYNTLHPYTGAVGDFLPATAESRNYSYVVVGDNNTIYYREDDVMRKIDIKSAKERARIAGMVRLADKTREIIELQKNGGVDVITTQLEAISKQYDNFVQQFGRLNSKENLKAFAEDNSLYLLCSLENLDSKGNFLSKSVFFERPTIAVKKSVPEHVNTADEALVASLCSYLGVDMTFMKKISGKSEKELVAELKGKIYFNPLTGGYETAAEFLSGYILDKVKAQMAAKEQITDSNLLSICDENISALLGVLPKPLPAEKIDVRLGANWIPADIVKDFVKYLLEPDDNQFDQLVVTYSSHVGKWFISNTPSRQEDTVLVSQTYGFPDDGKSAYKVLEDVLNLSNTNMYMDGVDKNGNRCRVFDPERSREAAAKQELIRQKFSEWIYKDSKRKQRIESIYNERFNSYVVREYDGSFLNFEGQSDDIKLLAHQKNAVARILFGGNTLLAHSVGAGKTFEMITGAMESKRFGLCNKPAIIVPKGLVEQTALEFVRLYPDAHLLIADKDSFKAENRKKLTARLVTGDYDCIIMSYEQFGKIGISKERQIAIIDSNIEELDIAIKLAADRDERRMPSVKALETLLKKFKLKRKMLFEKMESHRDDVIEFEMTGIDKIFIDEAHHYKNLFIITKMNNVRGISTSTAQKSEDLFMKTQYLNEITDGKGVVFATGTPMTNSMTEMYTMMRYLSPDALLKRGVTYFDEWAATFGEQESSIEVSPTGRGFQCVKSFSQFFNLPELMNLFRITADIQTAEMLNLDVPKANFDKVVAPLSEDQDFIMNKLVERANAVHEHCVDPSEDNMLKICSDGKKCGLDARILNKPGAPAAFDDFKESKVNKCVDKVYEIWEKTKDKKSTQVIFCDFSIPHPDSVLIDETTGKVTRVKHFNVYDDIKDKLIIRGIPEHEIAFIHDADGDAKKREKLIESFRQGEIRVLFGSTGKLGTGVNIQQKLIAAHHLDAPWRPADLEQRNGRIIRRGNENSEVFIYNYITEGSTDAYIFNKLEKKQKFISQVMANNTDERQCSDIGPVLLQFQEFKACALKDPRLKEFADVENRLIVLNDMYNTFHQSKLQQQAAVTGVLPKKLEVAADKISKLRVNLDIVAKNTHLDNENNFSGMSFDSGIFASNKNTANNEIENYLTEAGKTENRGKRLYIGKYRGHDMYALCDIVSFKPQYIVYLETPGGFSLEALCPLSNEGQGIKVNYVTRIDNVLNGIDKFIATEEAEISETKKQLASYKEKLNEPFPFMQELLEKKKRQLELKNELGIVDRDMDVAGGVEDRVTTTKISDEDLSVNDEYVGDDSFTFDHDSVTDIIDTTLSPATVENYNPEADNANDYISKFSFVDYKAALVPKYRLVSQELQENYGIGRCSVDNDNKLVIADDDNCCWNSTREQEQWEYNYHDVFSHVTDCNNVSHWFITEAVNEIRKDADNNEFLDCKFHGFTYNVPGRENGYCDFYLSELETIRVSEKTVDIETGEIVYGEETHLIRDDKNDWSMRLALDFVKNDVKNTQLTAIRLEREKRYKNLGWETDSYLRDPDFWNPSLLYTVETKVISGLAVPCAPYESEWLKVPENTSVSNDQRPGEMLYTDYFMSKDEAQAYVDKLAYEWFIDKLVDLKNETVRRYEPDNEYALERWPVFRLSDNEIADMVYDSASRSVIQKYVEGCLNQKYYGKGNEHVFLSNSYSYNDDGKYYNFEKVAKELVNRYYERRDEIMKTTNNTSTDIER